MIKEILAGELLDEATLSLDQFACACCVEKKWVLERLEAGILKGKEQSHNGQWYFVSEDLVRARRLVSIERSFGADAELAALVTDLIEEVHQLKQQLQVASESDR
ncbi:MAG TPA: chaperone modulator CbpM [Methylophilaceae bacterium]|nr:chaperone modulator CbpM [Methylophilaceae bacterium]